MDRNRTNLPMRGRGDAFPGDAVIHDSVVVNGDTIDHDRVAIDLRHARGWERILMQPVLVEMSPGHESVMGRSKAAVIPVPHVPSMEG
jgi:hypothetical protein